MQIYAKSEFEKIKKAFEVNRESFGISFIDMGKKSKWIRPTPNKKRVFSYFILV
jgi:hypothetical protein